MDCIVQGVAKSWTQLSDFHFLPQYHNESIGLYSVDFPGGASGKKKKTLPTSSGDVADGGSFPGLGKSPGGWHGPRLQCSCLENPTDESGRL